MLTKLFEFQKHFDALFPPLLKPSPEVLAQAALFVALRDLPPKSASSPTSPWVSLASRRFGGDASHRLITLQTDSDTPETITVHVRSVGSGLYDITVQTPSSEQIFASTPAALLTPTTLSTTLSSLSLKTTIVSQRPPPNVPASTSGHTMERLHIFDMEGRKTTLLLPSPKWLLSLGGDVLGSARGALRAPMPSVVVEVRVGVGEKVEKGQPVVVLESMKTETVLRAPVAGIVKAVGCKKGEMVEEGRELVDIDEDE